MTNIADHEHRIAALEITASQVKFFVRVVGFFMALLLALAGWLWHRAGDLQSKYDGLEFRYLQLSKRADALDHSLPITADEVLHAEFPKVYTAEMHDLIRTGDVITLSNADSGKFFGAAGGTGVLTTESPNPGGQGTEERMKIIKK